MIINRIKNYFILKKNNNYLNKEEQAIDDLIHFLWKEIDTSTNESTLKSRIKGYRRLSTKKKIESLPEIYLLLEEYSIKKDTQKGTSKQSIRKRILNKYPSLTKLSHFRPIFTDLKEQELTLCKLFLTRVLDKSVQLLGPQVSDDILYIKAYLRKEYDFSNIDIIKERKMLLDFSTKVYSIFKELLGINVITNIYLLVYKNHFQAYNLIESFTATLNVIPEEILSKDLIHFPSKQQMLKMLQEQLYSMEEINERLTKEVIERKKIEEKLKFSEDLKTTVLETAMDGTILATSEGIVVNWNKQAENILKVSREETIGKSIYSFVPKKLREELKSSFADYINTGNGQLINRRVETSVYLRDDSILYVELTIVPIKIKDDYLFNAFFRDITNRKVIDKEIREAKDMAEKSARAKSIFLSNMSHEIRTPLNVILGLTGILQKSDFSNPDMDRKNLDGIQFSAENLLILINDILDFSKIEAGKITLHQTDFNIHELLKNVSRGFKIKAEEKGLEFRLSIDDSIPKFIIGDQLRLNQILTNLLGNAVKFTHKGLIHINVSTAETVEKNLVMLKFQVEDTGIGIPKDKLSRIFKSFYQVHKPGKTKIEGTGLGLSISKKLIELQGGTMKVLSDLQKGSLFEFTLNYQKSKLKSQNSAKQTLYLHKNSKNLNGMKVLVAEDNKMNQFFISQLFNEWDIEADIANNGKEVLEKLEGAEYDLILMDMHMPVMDGIEATTHIRKSGNPEINQIPIVACSADVFPEAKRKAIEVGMNYYITKPVSEKALEEILYSLRDVSKQGQEALDRTLVTTTITEEFENLLNFDFLNKSFDNDRSAIEHLFEIFLEETSGDLIELQVSARLRDWKQIKHYSHKAKSSFRTLGLTQASSNLLEIETLSSKEEDIDKIQILSSSTQDIFDQVKKEIKLYLR